MLAPTKGLLCNLNHIHLQHISLGLHLSRHPELQESSGGPAGCGACGDSGGGLDANSNSPCTKCRCCEAHGLRNRPPQEPLPCPPATGDAASPCDPPSTSSSVSSCSDFSLDESPVSVYCRAPVSEEPCFPASQPGAAPAEEAPLLAGQGDPCGEGDPALGAMVVPRAATPPVEPPDSLCSSSSSSRSGGGSSLDSCSEKPHLAPEPPGGTGPDPNSNTVPTRWDHNRNIPPPVPPRPRRALRELRGDATKTITSFHELAQKRKRPAAPVPARGDRSDWLIVFSPDTELPPPGRLALVTGSPAGPQAPARPPACGPREVTTFKELRYRSAGGGKHRGAAAAEEPPPSPPEPPAPAEGAARKPPAPPAPGAKQPPKRRRSRPGLLPSADGEPGDGAEAAAAPGPPREETGDPGRAPWAPGKASRGDRTCKEALLVAVSASVDRIVAHFSAARNLVQKTQLGDSWLSPDVGYLLLHTLCPALCALVEDGLKPFQKDIITGQRRTSPWSVVEASAKPGPGTRALHALCCRVGRLAQLTGARQRFHAFILGLLNTKQLELWLSHLHKSPGVVSALYLPSSFLALSQGRLPQLADELLLLIQPLSVLTFHLDLLFEHHHLSVDVRPAAPRPPSPPGRPPSVTPAPAQRRQGGAGAPPGPDAHADGTAEGAPAAVPPVGTALQQTLQHVWRWGDQLGRSLLGAVAAGQEPGAVAGGLGAWRQQRNRGCRRGAAPSGAAAPQGRWAKPGAAAHDQAGTELRPLPSAEPGALVLTDAAAAKAQGERLPPASPQPRAEGDAAAPALPGSPTGPAKGTWLGRLFGATCPAAGGFTLSPDAPRSRRPSSWLAPRVALLAAAAKGAAPERSRAPQEPSRRPTEPPQHHRAVRALCDHAAAADDHLSFRKGDVLQLLGTVDEDWIRCCRGGATGLVPVGYTSLVL